MYKLQIMFKKTVDDDLIKTFEENVLIHLENASGQKVNFGEIVGAKLMEEPYHKSCELTVSSKEEMDKVLATAEGKKFNRSVASLSAHVSIFFINYGDPV